MADYSAPLRDMKFALHHVAGIDDILELDAFEHVEPELVAGVLDEAARFFEEQIAPLNRSGDLEGSQIVADGVINAPVGFKEAYAKYVAMNSLSHGCFVRSPYSSTWLCPISWRAMRSFIVCTASR